jgi:hypothetical protein
MKSCFLITAVLPAVALAGSPGQSRPESVAVPVQSLEITEEGPFEIRGYNRYIYGFQCDSSGRVLFIPLLEELGPEPRRVVRVAADGTSVTRINLSATVGARDTDTMISSIALDRAGQLHSLVGVATPGGGYQAILSLDHDGHLISRVDLDPDQIIAYRIAVFDSGHYLVLGRRRETVEYRVVVMPPGGGALIEVPPPTGSAWLTNVGSYVASGSDGQVYFAPAGGPAYAISATGDITKLIQLDPPQPGAVLSGLMTSRDRLAVVFRIPDSSPAQQWIAVYETRTGRRVVVYGPVLRPVMCYRPEGPKDQFTLLGAKADRMIRLNASAP